MIMKIEKDHQRFRQIVKGRIREDRVLPMRRMTAGLACLAILVCAPVASAELLPTYGLSIEGPKGWQSLQRDRGKRVAQWTMLHANGQPDKLIQIDCGRAVSETIDGSAASLAEELRGAVSKETVEVDGARALRVAIAHSGNGLQPVEVIVTSHEGLTYFIFGATSGLGSVHDAVEEVRKSWKWVKQLSPGESLATSAVIESAALGIRVDAPVGAAVVPGVPGRPSLHIAIRDPLKPYDEVLIMVQTPPLANGTDFDTVTTQLRDGWNAAGRAEGKFEWLSDDAKSKVVVSSVLLLKESPEEANKRGDHPRSRVVWAMRQLDDKSLLLINMLIISDDPKEIGRYSAYLSDFVRRVERLRPTK